MKLLLHGYAWVKQVLIQAPGFKQQSADTVAVYRTPEFLFGYGETYTYRAYFGIPYVQRINEP